MRDVGNDKVQTREKIAALEAMTQATMRSLTQAETRFASSVEDLGKKMDHLSDTIIKTLGELVGRLQQAAPRA
jgi:hypothetical protein